MLTLWERGGWLVKTECKRGEGRPDPGLLVPDRTYPALHHYFSSPAETVPLPSPQIRRKVESAVCRTSGVLSFEARFRQRESLQWHENRSDSGWSCLSTRLFAWGPESTALNRSEFLTTYRNRKDARRSSISMRQIKLNVQEFLKRDWDVLCESWCYTEP